jgi:hypothetical protein
MRYAVAKHPDCITCGERMIRWGWYDNEDGISYWLCESCMMAEREPCIRAICSNIEDTRSVLPNLDHP